MKEMYSIKSFKFLLLLVCLLISHPAWGEVYGSLGIRTEHYDEQVADCEDCVNHWGILGKFDLKFEKKSEKWELYFNPILRADNLGYIDGVFSESLGNEDRHESVATFREGYLVNKQPHWLQFGAGKRIFYWSVGEEIYPANFNPTRYLDIIELEELGLVSVWTTIDLPVGFYLEAAVPISATSQFPWDEDNRWRPPEIARIDILNADVPHRAQFAGRFGWRGNRGEFSVIYFNGYSTVQSYELVSPTALEPDYFRTQMLGGNFSADFFGWFGLKGEAAYRKQKGNQDNYVQWLIVVDKYMAWERKSLYLLFQFVKENVTDDGSNAFQDLDLSRALEEALTSKIEVEVGDWRFNFRGAYELDEEGYYLQPKLTYNREVWEISLAYDYLGGQSDSFFGSYEDNRRVFLELQYYF